MAEGQTTHIELLDGMETEIVQDPSGLTFYFLIDNNENVMISWFTFNDYHLDVFCKNKKAFKFRKKLFKK